MISWCRIDHFSLGSLCPSSHPYPCQRGTMCAKSPFKPTSGNSSDCDGKRLSEDSACCPVDNVIPCNATNPLFRCKSNPPGKSKSFFRMKRLMLMSTIYGNFISSVVNLISQLTERNTFYLMDLRKECIRYLQEQNLKTFRNSNPTVHNFRLTH